MVDDDTPSLTRRMQSGALEQRIEAAYLLGARPLDEDQLRVLRAALNDEEAIVRNQAAVALAEAGDLASLPDLIRLADASQPRDTTGVAWAIEQLAQKAGPREEEAARQALDRYRKRARGRYREHGRALLRRLDERSTGPRRP